MKRPAAAVAAPVAKKPAVSEPETVAKKPAAAESEGASKSCALVANAIANAPGYPPEVLAMLSDTLHQCLAIAKDERHAFQARMVEMIGEVLKSSEANIQGQLKVADEGVSKVEADKAGRESEEASMKAVVEDKTRAEEAAEKTLEESVGALNTAKEAFSKAQDEQKMGDAELEAAGERRATLTSTKTEVWDPLKEGSPEKPQSYVQTLMKVANDFSFDASMLTALPAAICKAPGDRGAFDAIVLEQVAAEFHRCTEALEQTITSGDSARSERAAKVSSSAAEFEQATESEKACREALKTAKAEKKEAVASRRVVSKALQALAPELKKAAAELERASASLEDFRMGPLMAFQELVQRSALAPAAEEPALEAEAALGEAPAEHAAAEGETVAAEGETVAAE